jgi:hypothetical protein
VLRKNSAPSFHLVDIFETDAPSSHFLARSASLRAGRKREEGLCLFFFPAVETAGYYQPSLGGDLPLSPGILTFFILRASASPR